MEVHKKSSQRSKEEKRTLQHHHYSDDVIEILYWPLARAMPVFLLSYSLHLPSFFTVPSAGD